jgi:hypothetical protein
MLRFILGAIVGGVVMSRWRQELETHIGRLAGARPVGQGARPPGHSGKGRGDADPARGRVRSTRHYERDCFSQGAA